MKEQGVDVIDCSSGGTRLKELLLLARKELRISSSFAEKIKKEVGIKTQAVGLIRTFDFANSILQEEKADLIALEGKTSLIHFGLIRLENLPIKTGISKNGHSSTGG